MKQIKFAAASLALLFVVASAFTNKKAFTNKQYGLISISSSGGVNTYTFADKALVAQDNNLAQDCESTGPGCTYTLDFDAISGETRSDLIVGSETVTNGKVVYSTTSTLSPDNDGHSDAQYVVTD